jgi:hypothetical protein
MKPLSLMTVFKKIIVLFLISLFGLIGLQAQPSLADSNLGLKYYQNKEFAKAAVVYRALYEKSPSKNYYIYLLNCLWEIQDFDEAEKLIKKASKGNKADMSYVIDLGYHAIRMGKKEQGEKIYLEAIEDLKADQQTVRSLAAAFSSRGEYPHAIKTYQKGRELLKNPTLFRNELSNAYTMTRNYDGMVSEGLAEIEENPQAALLFKNRFQALLRGDVQDNIYDMVRKSLLQKIQSYPQQLIYSEMLIWLYLQKNDFQSAFNQSKALDIRLKEDGSRIFTLAETAVFNDQPTIAAEMFEYLVKKGPQNTYYLTAGISVSKIRFNQLMNNPDKNLAQVTALHDTLTSQLASLGQAAESKELYIHLAHLKAFYLQEIDPAIQLLEQQIDARETKHDIRSRMKLELADIHLFSKDRWEAALLYGQVEKDNENNVIGHEAKLKKARLAYYTGDFRWAEAQLNVLKASTSKLVANDALYLSQLIQNNLKENDNNVALQLFAEADLFEFKKLGELALVNYDSIIKNFSTDPILDESYFAKAKILMDKADYEGSIASLDLILSAHKEDGLGDDALYLKAQIVDRRLNDIERAKELYQEFLIQFPSSIFAVEVRKRYRELRGDAYAS